MNKSVIIDEFCSDLAKDLKELRSKAKKTIIFCRTLSQCVEMFDNMKRLLVECITDPPTFQYTFLNSG